MTSLCTTESTGAAHSHLPAQLGPHDDQLRRSAVPHQYYGDSFTQCHQVSDGETWQEILAAHFGEPIRNFGVGGYGVYQAYRRMRRIEATTDSALYVILNIFSADHVRNLTWHAGSPARIQEGDRRPRSTSCSNANPWRTYAWICRPGPLSRGTIRSYAGIVVRAVADRSVYELFRERRDRSATLPLRGA